MKKFILLIIAAALTAFSCDVAEVGFQTPSEYTKVTLEPNITIAGLKALYTTPGKPVYISRNLIIGGQVTTSDQSGNFYRSLYIQDETGAIELKIGKTSMYNDFKIGQWVYVKCQGLTLGAYGGMVQLGYKDESGQYETAYLDIQYLIDAHVFRGEYGTPIAPEVIDAAGIMDPANYGKFVRIENATYSNQIFVILYDDTKPTSNSTYLRNGGTYGVTTWAMSENGFKAYMTPNGVAEPQSAFEGMITAQNWQKYWNAAAAYSVSQYFKVGSTDLQVRTSGYSKIADQQIPARILKGAAVNFTGILTYYNGNYQFVLIDLDGVEIAD